MSFAIRSMGVVMTRNTNFIRSQILGRPVVESVGSLFSIRPQSMLRIAFENKPPFKQPVGGFRTPHLTNCVNVKFMGIKGEDLLSFDSSRIRRSVNFTWNEFNTETAYQPNLPSLESFELTKKEVEALTSYFALANQSKTFQEGNFKYLFDAHKFQTQTVVSAIESCIRQYLKCDAPYQEKVQAQELHNMLINVGWLEKFVMFSEIKQTKQAQSFVPEIVSKPYLILSNLFGNHPEFTYYGHYVGATCANMSDRQQALKGVDFDTPQSIVDWVNEFKPLYSFETPENKERFQAEKYFRFIHLAMEMVYSQDAVSIHNLLTMATKEPDPKRKLTLIKDALELINKVEVTQNKVFKTLPLGSDPKLYNEFVRPYIAGTWGAIMVQYMTKEGSFLRGV